MPPASSAAAWKASTVAGSAGQEGDVHRGARLALPEPEILAALGADADADLAVVDDPRAERGQRGLVERPRGGEVADHHDDVVEERRPHGRARYPVRPPGYAVA